MILVLIRHGIAEELADMRSLPGKQRSTDADRALTPLGIRRVRKAARALKKIGFRADRILHSGLRRAEQTAALIAAELQPKEPELLVSGAVLSEADPRDLFQLLPELRARRVLVVGHAPHLDRVIALACGSSSRAITALGKAAAVALDLPDPARPTGRLLWLLPPKLLRALA